jgi:hypothetical protein
MLMFPDSAGHAPAISRAFAAFMNRDAAAR